MLTTLHKMCFEAQEQLWLDAFLKPSITLKPRLHMPMTDVTENEIQIDVGCESMKTNMLVFCGEARLGMLRTSPHIESIVSASFFGTWSQGLNLMLAISVDPGSLLVPSLPPPPTHPPTREPGTLASALLNLIGSYTTIEKITLKVFLLMSKFTAKAPSFVVLINYHFVCILLLNTFAKAPSAIVLINYHCMHPSFKCIC